MNTDRSFTNILFSTQGYLTGAMRVIDIFGQTDEYNESPNADSMALYADLVTVACDWNAALRKYKNVIT